jgi:hypothetical protein
VKEELAGVRLTPESLKKSWEGVLRTIGADEFAAAFRRWWTAATSVSGSTADTSRNLKK